MLNLLYALFLSLFATSAYAQSMNNPSVVFSGQVVIAVTNTAVCLPSNTTSNGTVLKARTANTGNGFVGGQNVTTTDTGAGNGYRLLPGEAISLASSNTATLCVNGTAGDIYYFIGN
jgi:hypothetical protein